MTILRNEDGDPATLADGQGSGIDNQSHRHDSNSEKITYSEVVEHGDMVEVGSVRWGESTLVPCATCQIMLAFTLHSAQKVSVVVVWGGPWISVGETSDVWRETAPSPRLTTCTICTGDLRSQNQNEQEVGTAEFVGQALLDVHDAMLYSKKLQVTLPLGKCKVEPQDRGSQKTTRLQNTWRKVRGSVTVEFEPSSHVSSQCGYLDEVTTAYTRMAPKKKWWAVLVEGMLMLQLRPSDQKTKAAIQVPVAARFGVRTPILSPRVLAMLFDFSLHPQHHLHPLPAQIFDFAFAISFGLRQSSCTKSPKSMGSSKFDLQMAHSCSPARTCTIATSGTRR